MLKAQNVLKAFNTFTGGCDQRVYIVRPEVHIMRQIAAHIHNDKRAGKFTEDLVG